MCQLRNSTVMVLDSSQGQSGANTEARCHSKQVSVATKSGLQLGGWTINLSKKGLAENACNKFEWWLNGYSMAKYENNAPFITTANIDE